MLSSLIFLLSDVKASLFNLVYILQTNTLDSPRLLLKRTFNSSWIIKASWLYYMQVLYYCYWFKMQSFRKSVVKVHICGLVT